MQLSRFLKIFPYPGVPGYLLLYSTKNSAMALVPEDDYQCLQHGEIPPDLEETLAELSMLVNDPVQEQRKDFKILRASTMIIVLLVFLYLHQLVFEREDFSN